MTTKAAPRAQDFPCATPNSSLAACVKAMRKAGFDYADGNFTCPAHEDSSPSLSVMPGNKRAVVLNCKVCEAEGVSPIELRNAFCEATGVHPGVLNDEIGDERGVWLDELGRGGSHGGSRSSHFRETHTKVAEYVYTDEDNQDRIKVERWEREREGHKPHKEFPTSWWDGYEWQLGLPNHVERIPYELNHFQLAKEENVVCYLVEGEKNADAVNAYGDYEHTNTDGEVVTVRPFATCFRGGAAKNTLPEGWARYFRGFQHVVIVADQDTSGISRALEAHAGLTNAGIECHIAIAAVRFEGADVSDHLDAGHGLDALQPRTTQQCKSALAKRASTRRTDEPGGNGITQQAADSEPSVVTGLPPGLLDEQGSSWRRVNLEPYIDGTVALTRPTIMRRRDGAHLFYPGRLNVVFGEPESGKSWLAFAAMAECLRHGEDVALIDYEDSPEGAVTRLRLLGVSDDQLRRNLRYVRPEERVDEDVVRVLTEGCSLVVIDATTEALSVEDLSSNSDVDVAKFYGKLPKLVARRGPAVILIDHVTKAWEGQNQQTGSQHKRAGVDGVSVKVENVDPFAPGRQGRSRLTVTKDRNGAVRKVSSRVGQTRNQRFGELVIPAENGYGWDLFEPSDSMEADTKDERDIALKSAVLKVARESSVPHGSRKNIAATLREKGVSFSDHCLSPALKELVGAGCLKKDYSFVHDLPTADIKEPS